MAALLRCETRERKKKKVKALRVEIKDAEEREASHLDLSGTFVSTAGDVDYKGPLIRLHQNSSSLGAGGVVRSWTAAMRALHAAA